MGTKRKASQSADLQADDLRQCPLRQEENREGQVTTAVLVEGCQQTKVDGEGREGKWRVKTGSQ